MKASRSITWIMTGLIVMAVSGCARGPDEAALKRDTEQRLNSSLKPGLVELASIKRQGSAPLGSSESGASRAIVYYNATLRLREGYDFNDWESLSPASIAQALGATERGISGIKAKENRPGDLLRLHGTAIYEESGGEWKMMTAPTRDVSPAPVDPGNAAPSSQAQRFVERLAATVDLKPGGRLNPEDERIVTEELERAIRAISRRRAREQNAHVFAMGPSGGEYARVVEAIVASIAKASRQVRLRTLETEGSVENAFLLGRGDVQYGLIQSDVATLAVAGQGPFAHAGPIASLAALGSLYPEPVHIVVPAKSAIRTVNDLRGKRVDLGAPGSGTRLNALAVLQAHGIGLKDLGEARDQGPLAAMQRLQSGQIDAFFTTIGAPGRELQRLATAFPIRMLSLSGGTIERLVTEHPSLVRLTLPANTYPGQSEPIVTVAPTALLVGTMDAPREEVETLLKLVFEQTNFLAAGSALGAKISRQSGLRGVAMPLHPGAAAYFGSTPSDAAEPAKSVTPSDATKKK